jgi:hypothetical protein
VIKVYPPSSAYGIRVCCQVISSAKIYLSTPLLPPTTTKTIHQEFRSQQYRHCNKIKMSSITSHRLLFGILLAVLINLAVAATLIADVPTVNTNQPFPTPTPSTFKAQELVCGPITDGQALCELALPQTTLTTTLNTVLIGTKRAGHCQDTLCASEFTPFTMTLTWSTVSGILSSISTRPPYETTSDGKTFVIIGAPSTSSSSDSTSAKVTQEFPTTSTSTSRLPSSSSKTSGSSKSIAVPKLYFPIAFFVAFFASTSAAEFINLKPYRIPANVTTTSSIQIHSTTESSSLHISTKPAGSMGHSEAALTLITTGPEEQSTSISHEDIQWGTDYLTSVVTQTGPDFTSTHVEVSTQVNTPLSPPAATSKKSLASRTISPPRMLTILTSLMNIFSVTDASTISPLNANQTTMVSATPKQVAAMEEIIRVEGPPITPEYFPSKSSSASRSIAAPRAFYLLTYLIQLCSSTTTVSNDAASAWYTQAANFTNSVPSLAGFLPSNTQAHSTSAPHPTSTETQPSPTSAANSSSGSTNPTALMYVLLAVAEICIAIQVYLGISRAIRIFQEHRG